MSDQEFPFKEEIPPVLPVVPPPDTPVLKDVVRLYLFSGVLLVFGGTFLQKRHLLFGLLLTEVLFLLSPPVLYAWQRKYDLARTFQIRRIPFSLVWLTIVATGAAFVLNGMLAAGQDLIFPRSQHYQEVWEQALQQFQQLPLGLTITIIAILPGVCEELFFRGFLLSGLRKRSSEGSAIVLVGLLFGLFHLDPYRFAPVTLLGILFGYLVITTGSIFTSMIAHITNNTIAILISMYAQPFSQRQLPIEPSAPENMSLLPLLLSFALLFGIALTILRASLRAILRISTRSSP